MVLNRTEYTYNMHMCYSNIFIKYEVYYFCFVTHTYLTCMNQGSINEDYKEGNTEGNVVEKTFKYSHSLFSLLPILNTAWPHAATAQLVSA